MGGVPDKPWDYKNEDKLRVFLQDRIQEGFTFPLNPVWPVRDRGWYDVLQALRNSGPAQASLRSWFPPEANLLDKIDRIHKDYPEGFKVTRREGSERLRA